MDRTIGPDNIQEPLIKEEERKELFKLQFLQYNDNQRTKIIHNISNVKHVLLMLFKKVKGVSRRLNFNFVIDRFLVTVAVVIFTRVTTHQTLTIVKLKMLTTL